MRHRVHKRHFNRDTNARKGLLREMLRSLIIHGEITTTKSKAKEIRRLTDKIIVKAKQNSIPARRRLHQMFGKRDMVNVLVDRIAPLFGDRKSGFTTLTVVGKRRGDNTEMVKLSLLKKPEVTGTLKAPAKKVATKKATAPKKPIAKKVPTKKLVAAKKATTSKKPVAKVAKKTVKKEKKP